MKTDLGECPSEVVAVLVHEVVAVAPKLVAHLLHNFVHVTLVEVRVAQDNALAVHKREAQCCLHRVPPRVLLLCQPLCATHTTHLPHHT